MHFPRIFEIDGSIADNGNNYKLKEQGNGTLALTGNNAFGGGFELFSGQLNLGNSDALGSSGVCTIDGPRASTSIPTAFFKIVDSRSAQGRQPEFSDEKWADPITPRRSPRHAARLRAPGARADAIRARPAARGRVFGNIGEGDLHSRTRGARGSDGARGMHRSTRGSSSASMRSPLSRARGAPDRYNGSRARTVSVLTVEPCNGAPRRGVSRDEAAPGTGC